MEKAKVIEFFESKLHPIDKNGNIKFIEKGKTFRYKFKDRVFGLYVKDGTLNTWIRLQSVYYADIETVADGKLKMYEKK